MLQSFSCTFNVALQSKNMTFFTEEYCVFSRSHLNALFTLIEQALRFVEFSTLSEQSGEGAPKGAACTRNRLFASFDSPFKSPFRFLELTSFIQ